MGTHWHGMVSRLGDLGNVGRPQIPKGFWSGLIGSNGCSIRRYVPHDQPTFKVIGILLDILMGWYLHDRNGWDTKVQHQVLELLKEISITVIGLNTVAINTKKA